MKEGNPPSASPPTPIATPPITEARTPQQTDIGLRKLRPWLVGAVFLLGIYVALNPSVVYTGTPRVVLFFMLGMLFSLIFVGEVQAQFKMELAGLLFTSSGVLAALCGILFLLTNFSKNEVQAVRITLRMSNVGALALDERMVKVKGLQGVASPPYFLVGEDLYIIYPEGVASVEIRCNPQGLRTYRRVHEYAGNQKAIYYVDKDFEAE